MRKDASQNTTAIESSQALTSPMGRYELNFIKKQLGHIYVSRCSEGMYLSLSTRIKGMAFKNPCLTAYKDDLLKRIEELTEKSGYEKIISLESVSFDYIRNNPDFCAKWAALVIELVGLSNISYSGEFLDNSGLTDRILTEQEDEELACFWG